MKYLITGATGNLGGGILAALAQTVDSADIAVLVRSQESGATLAAKGYDVRMGDFSDRASLEAAFEGIETLMFVSGAPGQAVDRATQHVNVIQAAVASGVQNLVYTSVANGDASQSVLAPDHIETERLIKSSGLHYKILRNNWYLENEMSLIQAAAAGQAFVYAGGEGLVGWALRRDYAQAAANALTQSFARNQIYELAGQAITYADLAVAVKEATGTNFEVLSVSLEDYQAQLAAAGLPEGVVGLLGAIQADIAANHLYTPQSDLEDLLGRSQTSLVVGIKELLAGQ